MKSILKNWNLQLRKGYIELCVLIAVSKLQPIYGFALARQLEEAGIDLKEGTLYPLLNRLAKDGLLDSHWQINQDQGNPRKFYCMTEKGAAVLDTMRATFQANIKTLNQLEGIPLNDGESDEPKRRGEAGRFQKSGEAGSLFT